MKNPKKEKGKRITGPSLSSLVKKFSKNDVIAEIEKEYQQSPSKHISLSLIDDTPFLKQVKVSPDDVAFFANNIKEKGIYSPLVVRPRGNHYQLILGRKRFYGAKKAKLQEVPCVIVKISDEEALLMLLADNRDQRSSNVVEMALICQALSDKFNYTQKTLADLAHESRSQITNTMRILRLPENVLLDLSSGKLSYGHAKAIVSLSQEEISQIVKMIYEHSLSVREVERIAKSYSGGDKDLQIEKSLTSACSAKNVVIKKRSVTFTFKDEESQKKFISSLQKKRN